MLHNVFKYFTLQIKSVRTSYICTGFYSLLKHLGLFSKFSHLRLSEMGKQKYRESKWGECVIPSSELRSKLRSMYIIHRSCTSHTYEFSSSLLWPSTLVLVLITSDSVADRHVSLKHLWTVWFKHCHFPYLCFWIPFRV